MANSIADILTQVNEESATVYPQIGRLNMEIEYLVWQDKKPTPTTKAQWDSTPKNARSANVVFNLDQKGFNPGTKFPDVKRNVKLGTSDWNEITLKSIGDCLAKSNMSYEEWADLASQGQMWASFTDQPSNYVVIKSTGKPLGIPKFTGFYVTAEECKVAAKELFGDSNSLSQELMVKATQLWNGSNGSKTKFLKAVTSDPELAEYADAIVAELGI